MGISIEAFRARMRGWTVSDVGTKPGELDREDVIRMPISQGANPQMLRVYYEDAVAAYDSLLSPRKAPLEEAQDRFERGVTDVRHWTGWENIAKAYRIVFEDLARDLRAIAPEFAAWVADTTRSTHSEGSNWQEQAEQFREHIATVREKFAEHTP